MTPAEVAQVRRHRRPDHVLVGAECALSLVLGFVLLGHKSLWDDETYSATVASGSWRSIYQSWREWDANMSLYDAILHVWRNFGSSDAFLRSLSVLAAAASVVVVYALGRRLFGATTGLLAGLIFAVAPFGVEYSQQVRSYALVVLLVTLSSYLFVVSIEGTTRGPWIAYVLVSVMAVYAHFFAVLVLVAHGVSLFFLDRAQLPLRRLLQSGAAIVVLLVPGAVLATTGRPDQLAWLPRPSLRNAVGQPSHVAGGALLAVIFLPLLGVAAVAGWHRWKARHRSATTWHVLFVFAWLAVPYAISLSYSWFLKPVFWDRFLIVSLPGLTLAAAFGISQLAKRWATAAVVVVVVASLVGVVRFYAQPSKEDWRGAVDFVLQRSTAQDGVLVCGHRTAFEYYVLQHDDKDAPQPVLPSDPWQVGYHRASAEDSRPLPPRIWVVTEGGRADRDGCLSGTEVAHWTHGEATRLDGLRIDVYDE